MIAYKVVQVESSGRYRSSWISGSCCRIYRIGCKTKPVAGTGLFAFNKLVDAVAFDCRLFSTSFKILKGRGRRRWKPKFMRFNNLRDKVVSAWAPENKNIGYASWPKGTIALKSFTPEEEI